MPDFKTEIRKRLAGLGLAPTRENEIVEEVSQHLEDQFEEAVSHGASEDEATKAVLTDLNDVLSRELRRTERRARQNQMPMGSRAKSNFIGDLMQDLRFALRMFAKNPAFDAPAPALMKAISF